MKQILTKNILLITMMTVLSNNSFSQVGIGISAPNASSMLDITSANKGLLIPRMSTANKTAISGPARSLLVFDTNRNTFSYYYNSSWHDLMGYITNNLVTDSVLIGTGTNYAKIESDGTISFNGSATVWNEFVVPASSAMQGTNPPVWAVFRNTVEAWIFNGSAVNELSFAVQMPRDWKEGSAIVPQIHWSPISGVAGYITWNIQYTWAAYGEIFPATTTITDVDTLTINNEYKHLITSFDPVSPSVTEGKISSILMIKLSRTANTYTGTVALLTFDILYESNTLGSRTKSGK